jgi:sugar lactone lactonase YvrE
VARFAPRPAVALASLLIAAACGAETSDAPPSEASVDEALPPAPVGIVVADAGFMTPESILHETGSDVYLVSNINGAPLDVDGNGFISRVSPEGEVLELKWIDGEAEGVTLNAPKGMAITGGTLWVSDIDCVRKFALDTGAPEGEVCIEGASFLNDLAPHPNGTDVILTDSGLDATFAATGRDAVYHVTADGYATIVADPEMGAPNGVAVVEGDALVVTFMSGQVYRISEDTQASGGLPGEAPQAAMMEILSVEGGQLDGIEVLADGRVLVSNWATSCVHLLGRDGTLTCAMPNLDAPADIGFDAERGHVLVPLFNENELRFIPLG